MTRITAPSCPPVDRASASTASEQARKAKPPKAPSDREGFRQAMSWLHTWAGLILGWLLFAIFLTGTLSFFKNEFNLWMRPEMHGLQPVEAAAPQVAQTAQRALDALVRKVPNTTQWIMHLPDDRNPAVNILWRDTGNGRFETLRMHPQTGEAIDTRQTMGGDFFYRFHFELRTAQKGRWTLQGRWVVGVATMMMFVALISGVVVGGAGRPRRGGGLVWPAARTKADTSSEKPARRRGVVSGFWRPA